MMIFPKLVFNILNYMYLRHKVRMDKSSHHHEYVSECGGSGMKASLSGCVVPQSASTPCPNCLKQKKQIDLLIERQLKNEKELIRMRNEYEVKLLNKSLELSSSKTATSSSKTSESNSNIARSAITSTSSSGANTPAAPIQTPLDNRAADWVRYFASRPQTQPPK